MVITVIYKGKNEHCRTKETNEEMQGPGQIENIDGLQHSSVLQKFFFLYFHFPTMKQTHFD